VVDSAVKINVDIVVIKKIVNYLIVVKFLIGRKLRLNNLSADSVNLKFKFKLAENKLYIKNKLAVLNRQVRVKPFNLLKACGYLGKRTLYCLLL